MSGIAPEAGAERDIRSALPSDDLGDTPVLELRKLDKWFTGTHALKSVDLAFRQHFRNHVVNTDVAGDLFGGDQAIAAQHHDLQAAAPQ